AGGLVLHDRSALSYPGHARQPDQARLTHRQTRGYERTTLLLVEGGAGHPIAPSGLRLRTAHGVCRTRTPAPAENAYRVGEGPPSMPAAGLGLSGPLVHVIDREADAPAPYRAWQADGRHPLVRAHGGRRVRWPGPEVSPAEWARRLDGRRCR